MTNLILLIGNDGGPYREIGMALKERAPVCQLERATGRSEIEALSTPGLILLDLAYKAAFDILRWLRTEQRYKEVPVFALAPPSVDVNDAYALGANSCFLQKPAREELKPLADGIAAYASLLAETHAAA